MRNLTKVAIAAAALACLALALVIEFHPSANVQLSGSPQALADALRPVAIVPLENNRYMITNYTHLSIVDLNKLRVTPLTIEWKIKPGVFVPAGLSYDTASHELFIANYRGNNILEAEVDKVGNKVLIRGAFGAGSIVSPEGISYDRQRQLLASAQYDGNSVTLFQRSLGQWHLKCTVAAPQAHGVALAGGYMFATSLANHELLKINIERCAVERRIGKSRLGWPCGPVYVASCGRGSVQWNDCGQRCGNWPCFNRRSEHDDGALRVRQKRARLRRPQYAVWLRRIGSQENDRAIHLWQPHSRVRQDRKTDPQLFFGRCLGAG